MVKSIKHHIEDILQEKISILPSYSGKLQTESGKYYFLKTGTSSNTFACETHGLEELAKANAIDVVKPIAFGNTFILTEFVEEGRKQSIFFEEFGTQFARLHKHKGKQFGFYEDNFIGVNPQFNIAENTERHNWTAFYFNKRLLFQYHLAEKNGFVSDSLRKNFARLENKIDEILGYSEETPALLHGDLWAGNFICNLQGQTTLIDPAVYYGHREADLAMTKVFGGFSEPFYSAYQAEYPLADGWEYREDIYKLYHILNHLNIFGRGYLSEAEWIVHKYIS